MDQLLSSLRAVLREPDGSLAAAARDAIMVLNTCAAACLRPCWLALLHSVHHARSW